MRKVKVGEGLLSPSCAGLTRVSTTSNQLIIEIIPTRVVLLNQPNLPAPPPMLDVLFTLHGRFDCVVMLRPNETLKVMLFGEALDRTFAMLPSTPSKVTGDAYIERPFGLVGYNVDPSAFHGGMVARVDIERKKVVDTRVKPAHDG